MVWFMYTSNNIVQIHMRNSARFQLAILMTHLQVCGIVHFCVTLCSNLYALEQLRCYSHLRDAKRLHMLFEPNSLHSSIASPCAAAGTLPSFNSFSNLIISCRLFAFLINSSTLFLSLSVSLTRRLLVVEVVAVPFALETSNVFDLTPMIYKIISFRVKFTGEKDCTCEANDEGSSTVPNNSFAFSLSASLTFL